MKVEVRSSDKTTKYPCIMIRKATNHPMLVEKNSDGHFFITCLHGNGFHITYESEYSLHQDYELFEGTITLSNN